MTISKTLFGSFWHEPVFCYTLENRQGVSVNIIDYGAIIQSLKAPGNSTSADIILGFDTLYGYLQGHPFFGAVAGRVANRIPDGQFSIDGIDYQLGINAPCNNHLHGGFRGFDKYVWKSDAFSEGDTMAVRLNRLSPDGEEGYPGTLDTTITYTLSSDNVLGFEVTATTDTPTIVNIVQHSYMNMAGHDSGDVTAQLLIINADTVTPTDGRLCPTGDFLHVAGTPYDLREPTLLGAAFQKNDGIFDINYVLKPKENSMAPCASFRDPKSGRTMTIATTLPGIQFYNGHKLFDQNQVGKGGHRYPRWAGICLETQGFPNAVNHDHFPSMVLRPGEQHTHKTTYSFSVE